MYIYWLLMNSAHSLLYLIECLKMCLYAAILCVCKIWLCLPYCNRMPKAEYSRLANKFWRWSCILVIYLVLQNSTSAWLMGLLLFVAWQCVLATFTIIWKDRSCVLKLKPNKYLCILTFASASIPDSHEYLILMIIYRQPVILLVHEPHSLINKAYVDINKIISRDMCWHAISPQSLGLWLVQETTLFLKLTGFIYPDIAIRVNKTVHISGKATWPV